MKYQSHSFEHLTHQQLLAEVKTLSRRERDATARLIASLSELDRRRLYLGEGYSSMFTYCTQCLRLSEHAAYGRIDRVDGIDRDARRDPHERRRPPVEGADRESAPRLRLTCSARLPERTATCRAPCLGSVEVAPD